MERIFSYSLGDDLIRKLADFSEENFLSKGKDTSRLAFVFGGSRPALFLKRELSRRVKKGFFSPQFFSMDEFVEYCLLKKGAFLKLADLDACYLIYKLAAKIAPGILEGRQAFADFLPWAREIHSFIEQLDLEDIAEAPLENIQFKARIGYDVPENINRLLESIIAVRGAFHAELGKMGAYSRGLIYLSASKAAAEDNFSEFDAVVFCGAFYLHKTEKRLIKNLFDREKAILFFQGDSKDWSVLQELSAAFNQKISPEKNKVSGYNLVLQAGFDLHSQACLAREALKETKDLGKTVVVLPNPDNVIPLLAEISSLTDDFNVSMGYPLNRSSLYSLFQCLFKAQETRKADAYYTKDYLKALGHPLIKNLKIFPNPSVTRVLAHKIEEVLLGIEENSLGGSLFIKLSDIQDSRELYDLALETMKKMDIEISWEELKSAVSRLHSLLFLSWEKINNFQDFCASLEVFLDMLVKISSLAGYPLNLKMAEKIFLMKEELAAASFKAEPFSKEDIFRIFKNNLDNEKISFSGSPLKGLQVLGMLETRLLNFENVIVLDVNESVLPALKIYEPLIPREVMIGLGINRLEKEEEIQRYQFRRLISGAKNVHLIYQKSDEKEKSRFIEELIWERQKEAKDCNATVIPQAAFRIEVLPKRAQIIKDKELINFLRAYEYSASSINTYLSCPMRFYYEYGLGLREKEGLLDEPEARDIGNFIHELLEDTFSRFIGSPPLIDAGFRKYFFEAMEEKFEREFRRKMKSDSFLIKGMLDFRMERFLENEKARRVKEILCLEKKFRGEINFSCGAFKFSARIDRIDRLSDNSILVLDYKTGGAELPAQVNAEKIRESSLSRETLKETVKSFQLPLYLFFVESQPEYKGLRANAGLYAVKDLKDNSGINTLFKKEEQFKEKDKILRAYLDGIGFLLEEILNPAIPFKAAEEDAHYCQNCPFFYLCR